MILTLAVMLEHAQKACGLARALHHDSPTAEHEELLRDAEAFLAHVARLVSR